MKSLRVLVSVEFGRWKVEAGFESDAKLRKQFIRDPGAYTYGLFQLGPVFLDFFHA